LGTGPIYFILPIHPIYLSSVLFLIIFISSFNWNFDWIFLFFLIPFFFGFLLLLVFFFVGFFVAILSVVVPLLLLASSIVFESSLLLSWYSFVFCLIHCFLTFFLIFSLTLLSCLLAFLASSFCFNSSSVIFNRLPYFFGGSNLGIWFDSFESSSILLLLLLLSSLSICFPSSLSSLLLFPFCSYVVSSGFICGVFVCSVVLCCIDIFVALIFPGVFCFGDCVVVAALSSLGVVVTFALFIVFDVPLSCLSS